MTGESVFVFLWCDWKGREGKLDSEGINWGASLLFGFSREMQNGRERGIRKLS
jgi:hypothetical protein